MTLSLLQHFRWRYCNGNLNATLTTLKDAIMTTENASDINKAVGDATEAAPQTAEAPWKVAAKAAAGEAEVRRESVKHEVALSINVLSPQISLLFRQLSSLSVAWMSVQGFWESENFGEKLALVHSELSEALEAHRKDLRSDHIPEFHGVEEELADALIRIFDLAGKHQVRLGEAFAAKFLFNLTRPHKHGKAY